MATISVATILNANAALKSMRIEGGASYKVVRGIRKLQSMLDDEIKIVMEEQAKIITAYRGTPTGDGHIEFSDMDEAKKAEAELIRLDQSEIELDYDSIDLSPFVDNIIFQDSNVDVDALSAFIIFEKE